MRIVRLYLRSWVTLWLVFQAASLSAFVPGNCCADHERAPGAPSEHDHAGVAPEPCHDATPADQCPMRGADGAPCPMHQGPRQEPREQRRAETTATPTHAETPSQAAAPTQSHDRHQHHGEQPTHAATTSQDDSSDACVLRGTCGGPMATLGTVLSNIGVMPAPAPTLASVPSVPVSPVPDETTTSYFESPDPPPPRV